MTAPRPFTPAKLAELLAALRRQGVPVTRARLTPDGALDIEIDGTPANANPFDLADMTR